MGLKPDNDNAAPKYLADHLARDTAYDYGQDAAKQGIPPAECPFDEDDDADLAAAWMDGYYSAADMLADVDDDDN